MILPFYMVLAEKIPTLEFMVTALQENRDKWQEMAEADTEVNIP